MANDNLLGSLLNMSVTRSNVVFRDLKYFFYLIGPDLIHSTLPSLLSLWPNSRSWENFNFYEHCDSFLSPEISTTTV